MLLGERIKQMFSVQNMLTICGVIYALFGVSVTAAGQMFEKPSSIVLRHMNVPGCNPDALKAEISNTMKASYGFVLVLIGNSIQLVAIFLGKIGYFNLCTPLVMFIAIALIAPLLFYCCIYKKCIQKAQNTALNTATELEKRGANLNG